MAALERCLGTLIKNSASPWPMVPAAVLGGGKGGARLRLGRSQALDCCCCHLVLWPSHCQVLESFPSQNSPFSQALFLTVTVLELTQK